MDNFSSRLEDAMEMRGMSIAALSRQSGVSESMISRYRKASFVPKNDQLVKIADALDVSTLWLMGTNTAMERDQKYKMAVSAAEHDFLADLRSLRSAQRGDIMAFVHFLAKGDGNA